MRPHPQECNDHTLEPKAANLVRRAFTMQDVEENEEQKREKTDGTRPGNRRGVWRVDRDGNGRWIYVGELVWRRRNRAKTKMNPGSQGYGDLLYYKTRGVYDSRDIDNSFEGYRGCGQRAVGRVRGALSHDDGFVSQDAFPCG